MTSGRSWPHIWRAGLYLLGSLGTGIITLATLPLLCHPALARRWAERHRAHAARLLGLPVTPRPAEPSTARRDLLWLPVNAVTGVTFGLITLLCAGNLVPAAVATALWWAFTPADRPRLFVDVPVDGWTTALTLGPLQLVLLSALTYLMFPPLARLHARICRTVLAPSAAEQLTGRVAELTRTRAEVLDAHSAELRRIERDLHDGTQARLVSIAMRLAVAREAFADEPRDEAFVAELLRDAHESAEQAMTELRDVLRGVYPPILADRGLTGALTAVAAGCGVPVRLGVDDVGRVPAAVEAVVYFAVAEALTNITKHSRATAAGVRLTRTGKILSVIVTDDGTGGADPQRGTGLAGIRRRILALDGTVHVDSPGGGPTTITLEVPCG